ncbi:U-box domain-containing protein 5 [Mercurialis annua]|uniref:U-box domain-containing protein 5 n=1 Tax=Mercurialis annua TaxID=3986 RepID=UPI00215E8A2A|nr:U-box domain-containing protein 5 [Mercurialis annua]XP_050229060.1 U-box domain-containing protein 5 [Mercurialis annua]XP_050229061.1 U-box domain-containing protein 5 [Mercurialis annua]
MGTDAADVVETLPYNYSFKVHHSMCMELRKLVDRIDKVFPEIEDARPRCSTGIHSLCLLNGTTEKAKQILRHCCESSKLYLVLSGDAILSRCQRSRKDFEKSLGQIQTMVPTMLAAEISRVIDDLNGATFVLDPSDAEAGKAVRELIQQGTSASDSVDNFEMRTLQVAALKLHITSPKAILIEKRSIRKLLVSVGDNDPTKKKILKYLLYLLKKYGNLIMEEHIENSKAQESATFVSYANSSENNPPIEVGCGMGIKRSEASTDVLSSSMPPEEFKCPISMRVMYDPVVIASGQTFERMWIEKWFNDGNDTCPKTKMKLPHRVLTPNKAMKDLISKWCEKYGIPMSDPSIQEYGLLDISSTSIASLGISMNDLHLPLDISSVSLGSLDASYSLDSSRTKVADSSSLMSTWKTEDLHRFQSNECTQEAESKYLTRLSELQWDFQSKLIEDVKGYLQSSDQACHSLSSENFVEPLMRYLKDASEQRDVKAQLAGLQLLLTFASQSRSRISLLHEDAFDLLASFLESEVVKEALAVLEAVSSHSYCRSKITASGALVLIIKILDSQSKELQERAVRILLNLSSNSDICLEIINLDCTQKLVPFINDGSIARHCIVLLKKFCDAEEGRISVTETNGCIASISQLLESGSREEQEHAVSLLLTLCSQRVEYCQLVMDEGVIPSLVDISINGNEKGKASALELLRQFRNVPYENTQESVESDPETKKDAEEQQPQEKKSSSRFFRRPVFSKPGSLFTRKGR